MTTTVNTPPNLASRLVNQVLAIKPLANLAKHQARSMMIKRAEKIGVPWRQRVQELQTHDWDSELASVQDPKLTYPEYYLRSFHAYEQGNLSWDAALEVEVASYAVHAGICPEDGIKGDAKLRQSYHDIIKPQVTIEPQDVLDLGCSVGLSTFALQKLYPLANITGLDLSPYYIAVARYNSQQRDVSEADRASFPGGFLREPASVKINWRHAAAETTGFPNASFDLVSACLMFHELPQAASKQILCEARRLLRLGGYLTIMDMNPRSEVYAKMPPYILTLLKSTEPYLDEYFTLNIEESIVDAGFQAPTITPNSPRHRTIVAQVK